MAYERTPRDPADANPARDPDRSAPPSDDSRDRARPDNDLQVDPKLAEGRANRGKIAVFAIGIAVVLGAVFYGLNSSSSNHAATSSSSTARNSAPPPAAPPGMRDVTPRNNTQPGVTTGAAPAQPQTPPSSSPPATTEINHSGNPPTGNAAPTNTPAPAK